MGQRAFLREPTSRRVAGGDARGALAAHPRGGKVGGGTGARMVVRRSMFRTVSICLVLAAATIASGAQADGPIGTLPLGRYLCELPGDAAGPASRPIDKAWFDVTNGSSYRAATGKGTYLLRGDEVVFTRGPMRGARFERMSPKALQRTNLEGEFAKMRCVRTGPAR